MPDKCSNLFVLISEVTSDNSPAVIHCISSTTCPVSFCSISNKHIYFCLIFFFKPYLEISAASVVLFSDRIHHYTGNHNNCVPPKKTVTHRAPATSYCCSSEHSTLVGCARSELRNSGRVLAVHKEGLSSTRGLSQTKNPKQESQKNINTFLLSRGQPMADLSHVYYISAINQASLWGNGLTRRRKISIVLEATYYVLSK